MAGNTSFKPPRSPLDTLLRTTSVSHRKAKEPFTSQSVPAPAQLHHTIVGTPPKQRRLSPTSPLLHSHFRGSSTTTLNDNSSYLDRSTVSGDDSAEYHYYDDESLYSNPSVHSDDIDGLQNSQLYTLNGGNHPFRGSPDLSDAQVVPTVIISPAERDGNTSPGMARSAVTPTTVNFSRPVYLSSSLDEQKRQVLERNSRRFRTPQPSPYSSSPSNSYPRAPSPTSPFRTPSKSSSTVFETRSQSSPSSSHPPLDSTVTTYPPPSPDNVNASPAPIISQSCPDESSLEGIQAHQQLMLPTDISPKHPVISPSSQLQARTPQEYVQLGIQHHEANRLKDSASCFEKSAKERGGCGVGMLMWGLALRHGWGCEKDEKQAFKWLRKAAESAVVDLEAARGGMDTNAVQTELVLAIYEVAQCFFQGWGVSKDRKMAVSYYAVAARLGDADAQHDLAFCLANGKGCKKDRKESAKWYRAAVAQGASDVGLAWIYKEKFQ